MFSSLLTITNDRKQRITYVAVSQGASTRRKNTDHLTPPTQATAALPIEILPLAKSEAQILALAERQRNGLELRPWSDISIRYWKLAATFRSRSNGS